MIYSAQKLVRNKHKKEENPMVHRIKVLKTPDFRNLGKIPLDMRAAFVGVTLPCLPYIGYPVDEKYEILTGEQIVGKSRGVLVPQMLAVAALSIRNPKVTVWWLHHGFPHPDRNFFFAEGEIHLVEGVEEAPIRLLSEETVRHRHHMA